MTVNEAKRLRSNQTVYEVGAYNADGTPRRWRVSGMPQTWKRDPGRIRVPIKHGLYAHYAIDEHNAQHFVTKEPPPRKRSVGTARQRR